MSRVRVPFPAQENPLRVDFSFYISIEILAAWPSGLRRRSAKPLFIGSNPIAASINIKPDYHNRVFLFMGYFVYILRSLKDFKRYIGMTSRPIGQRVREHNSGLVKSTKNRLPLELIYFENFDTKIEAMQREKFFKSGKGREYLTSIGK